MAQKMLQYIKEQPLIWQKMIEERNTLFNITAHSLARPPKRIIILGSGSSYIASMAAAEFYGEMLKIETTASVPTRLENLMRLQNPEETVLIAVSQSGKSTSTIGAVREWKAQGFPVLTVTADPQSPVALEGCTHQLIACGEETVGPKTKGMTGTVLTLFLLGLELGRAWNLLSGNAYSSFLSEMDQALKSAPANIEKCINFCRRQEDLLAVVPHITVISEKAGFYAAQEGALKLLETLYIPVTAYEFEEYMHGINNTIAPGMCHLFLPSGLENADRMATLESYTRKKGCVNLVITSLDWEDGAHVLKLEGSREPFCAIFQALLAFQIMSVFGSERREIECDRPKFPDFYEVMNTKA